MTSAIKTHLTKQYRDYIESPEWCLKRAEKIVESGPNCQLCGKVQKPAEAHVHHWTYKRLGAELLEDLGVLCRDCHREVHVDSTDGKVYVSSTLLRHIAELVRSRLHSELLEAWKAEAEELRTRLLKIDPGAAVTAEARRLEETEQRRSMLLEQLRELEKVT